MIRLFIRRMLQKVGYDIVKYHPAYVVGRFDEENLEGEFTWLREFNFKTILDIGANEGQFADKMHQLFPDATIYSFEPIPESFERLKKNFENIKQVVGINIAVGEEAGELDFNQNESTASSSFLELTDTHKGSFDFAVKVNPVKVKVDTLDHVMANKEIESPFVAKIDVQGFEDKVIKGGQGVLQKAAMIICEVSFVELYKGQPLFNDIYDAITRLGFVYSGSIEQLRSPETNKILQADAVFIKKSEF